MNAADRGPHRTYRISGGHLPGERVWIEGETPASYVETTESGLVVVRVDGVELALPRQSVRARRAEREA